MASRKNSVVFGEFNGKQLIPPEDGTLSGTYSSAGQLVTCPDSSYLDALNENTWIYEEASEELRKVIGINRHSNVNTFFIDAPFTIDLAAATLKHVESKYRQLSVANTGAADGTVDLIPIKPTVVENFNQGDFPQKYPTADPIAINGTGTTLLATGNG